jgi:hypothetical protein
MAAAAHQVHAGGSVPGIACALLAVELTAGRFDLATTSGMGVVLAAISGKTHVCLLEQYRVDFSAERLLVNLEGIDLLALAVMDGYFNH